MKIAVIGSGIAGLASAWELARAGCETALFEAGEYFGGHTHTVDVLLDGQRFGVDTGFLVFNHRTYPNLVGLLDQLDVPTAATDMSFSVKLPAGDGVLEWSGHSLDTVFAQRGNLLRPAFLGMLRDLLRFNTETRRLTATGELDACAETLGEFLARRRYGQPFRDWYLLPMAGCIWSCPTRQMLDFPLASFVRFCANHGLLQIAGRPQWHTVRGGARQYVEKMLAAIPRAHLNTPVTAVSRADGHRGVRVVTRHGTEHFDHVVLAVHSDQALALLRDADAEERAVLGAIRYQPNRAVLHTDTRCLPARRKTWSAWNYEGSADGGRVCVHYLLNRLQPLPCSTPLVLSLNPVHAPDAGSILGSCDYAHPVFDAAAIAAQRALPSIQGRRAAWFAGAWTGYGFHEDGLKSGLAVARALLRQSQQSSQQASQQPSLQQAA